MATVSEYSVMSDQRAIEFQALSFSYCDRQALKDVSFDVGDGELFSLLGPNGSSADYLISLAVYTDYSTAGCSFRLW